MQPYILDLIVRMDHWGRYFKKNHCLVFSEISEAVGNPGIAFEYLVGPWFEEIESGYYMISPLLRNLSKSSFSEEKRKRIQHQMAHKVFELEQPLNMHDFSRGFFLAYFGGDNKLIDRYCVSMLASITEWGLFAPLLDWLLFFGLEDNSSKKFTQDDVTNINLRLIQFLVSINSSSDKIDQIIAAAKEEFRGLEGEIAVLYPFQFYFKAVFNFSAKVPVSFLVESVYELSKSDQMGNITGEAITQFPERIMSSEDALVQMLYLRKFSRQELDDLFKTLYQYEDTFRDKLFNLAEKKITDADYLLNSAWMVEQDKRNPEWEKCLEFYDRVIKAGREWSKQSLVVSAFRCKLVIHTEYLGDFNKGLEIINIDEFTNNATHVRYLKNAMANAYHYHSRHSDAVILYEEIITGWMPDPSCGDMDSIFACERCASSFGRMERWSEAAYYFEEAEKRSKEYGYKIDAVANRLDSAHANFMKEDYKKCIIQLYKSLKQLDTLEAEFSSDVQFRSVRTRAGHLVLYFKQELSSRNEKLIPKIPIGYCSNREIIEKKYRSNDMLPLLTWKYLGDLDVLSDAMILECQEIARRLSGCEIPLVIKETLEYKVMSQILHMEFDGFSDLLKALFLLISNEKYAPHLHLMPSDEFNIDRSKNYGLSECKYFLLASMIQLATKGEDIVAHLNNMRLEFSKNEWPREIRELLEEIEEITSKCIESNAVDYVHSTDNMQQIIAALFYLKNQSDIIAVP